MIVVCPRLLQNIALLFAHAQKHNQVCLLKVQGGETCQTLGNYSRQPMAAHFNIIGAIDFGTAYSGWAFSFDHDYRRDPTKATVKNWHCGSGTLCTEKTPTVALINPDGNTLKSFGYNAENEYRELVENGNHATYFYFRRFKMSLYKTGKELNRDLVIEDEMKHSMKAMDVFAMCIEYLVKDMMKSINDQLDGLYTRDHVKWILTVPAIWTDGAKQFMRESAMQAGINTQHLYITLEPESASMFCRHLNVSNTADGTDVSVATFAVGTKYLVLDAGGGTIDTTVHEVLRGFVVKEIHAAGGGDWGGTMVDKAFETLLEALIGKNVYKKFKEEETEDWLDLWRSFEYKKRDISPDKTSVITMKIPCSLNRIHQSINDKSIAESIKSSIYAQDIKPVNLDKLKFNPSIFSALFDDTIQHTIQLVKDMLNNTKATAILMVGGFSESPLLQHAVKTAFPNIKVIIPLGASSAILRGALIMGHNPASILERVLRYSYGVGTTAIFDEEEHPEMKRIYTDSYVRCTDIFDTFASVNQSVRFGESQMRRKYTAIRKDQTQIRLPLFATECPNPKYTDEHGCTNVGEVIVQLHGKYKKPTSAKVKVTFIFSGTEIVVEALEKKTKKVTKATVNFLG